MQDLTVRRNSVANCQRLDSKISTGLEVVMIPIDECRFESCPRSQKIVVVLQNFEKNQHRCRGKL